MFQVSLKKAMTGFNTLVITLGLQVRPNTRTYHSKISFNHLNLKYFLESGCIGI